AKAAQVGGFYLRVDSHRFPSRDRNLASGRSRGTICSFPCSHNSPYPSFSRLRRRLFVTTLNELKAIAALASTGLSSNPQTGYRIPAAIGIPTTLYARAQNRFW